MKWKGLLALALTLAAPGAASAQQPLGYRLAANRVAVGARSHWEAWGAPHGARVVEADGTVRPRLLRRDLNASLNAGDFQYTTQGDTLTGGVYAAGSNAAAAALAMDGDLGTYWEPDRGDPVSSWFLEIDLGRVVPSERVVVRFAEEGHGDPFLKFRVMASSGLTVGPVARGWGYFRVGLRTEPNEDVRHFEFAMEPQRPMPPGVTGEPVQFVRIEVLDSRGNRGRLVGLEEFLALPQGEQGAVDYYRRTSSGRQIRVNEGDYLRLPPPEQGEVHHYRHERPRLSELEVYALGDNAVRATRAGVDPRVQGKAGAMRMSSYTDGRHVTYRTVSEYDENRDESRLEIDLGATYWLDRVRLLSPDQPSPAYQIRVSDGALNPNGQRIWHIFPERLNLEAYRQVEEHFPLRETRYIDLRRLSWPAGRRENGFLSEVLALGEGYVSEVVLSSPIIKLGRPRLFTEVTWEAQTPGTSRVEVRSRTGDELLYVPHYYHYPGRETSRAVWERLPEETRPPVEIEELPAPDWSPWSDWYRQSGQPFKSPSPRRYAMMQVRLLAPEPLQAAAIRQLDLSFVPPLVDGALAEIWPRKGIPPGQQRDFTVYVRPVFASRNPGFDRLRLESGSSEPMEVLWVRAGTDLALRRGTARQLWPGEAQLETEESGAVTVTFPEPVLGGDDLFAIRFRTRVFLSSTLFGVQLTRQTLPGRVQTASAGEASALVSSQSLAVLSDVVDTPLLGRLEIDPSAFTPNGDGINDAVAIELDVFVIEGEHRLSVTIHDLRGYRVRQLSLETAQPSGGHRIWWDGRDDSGRLAPPGIYLVRAGFGTDAGRQATTAVRPVHLVY